MTKRERWVFWLSVAPFGVYIILRQIGVAEMVVRKVIHSSLPIKGGYSKEEWGYLFLYVGIIWVVYILGDKIFPIYKKVKKMVPSPLFILVFVFFLFLFYNYLFFFQFPYKLPVVPETILKLPPPQWYDTCGNFLVAKLLREKGVMSFHEVFSSNYITQWRLGFHPPIFFLLLSVLYPNYVLMNWVNVVLVTLLIWGIILLGKSLGNLKLGVIAGVMFVCFHYYLQFFMRGCIDVIGTLFGVFGVWFYLRKTKINALIGGIFLGLGVLSKYSNGMVIIGIGIYYLIKKLKQKKEEQFFKYFILGGVLVILPWIIYLILHPEIPKYTWELTLSKPTIRGYESISLVNVLSYIFRFVTDMNLPFIFLCLVGGVLILARERSGVYFLVLILSFVCYSIPMIKAPELRHAMPGAPFLAIVGAYGMERVGIRFRVKTSIFVGMILSFSIKLILFIHYYLPK